MEIQKKLDHPNIVKLHTWFEESAFFYLVMEPLGLGFRV